ncbi:zinc finger B-box domain-containing protein 1 isoform X2 [Triplophysa dalaica]|uniref:zinc finger B-box domain-containing protein 1 isoform X2 n=1 Tax=Triplophysa dalaica TaxID=1582913 RepID=UPI0024DFF974|nr:zinc finger B-box domain-containing protein 1 isoform X2 [Triplophysa dalaica]
MQKRKPKSMKLNVRNLRELRMEKVQLDKQTRDMEIKLEELRERMSQEKEEREKTGRARWRSSQPGVLGPGFHDAKTNKENAAHTLSPGKMKIRVLKDEPLPVVQKQTVAEPAVKTQDTIRKLRLRGRVCGQCEVQLAGLMCSECGEDYCVGCFVRFHQKGALQRHRMIPIQAQLQTPVTTRDVLGRVQEQVRHQQRQLTPDTVPKSAQERETPEQIKIKQPDEQTHRTQVLFVNDGVDVDDEEGGKVEDSSLLRGYFDEEESARFFQEALKEWREKGRTGDAFRAGPAAARPVSAMETQTEKKDRQFIHLEFKEDTLSYMEKLLLKQSRRGLIEHFESQSDTRRRPDPTTPPSAETDEQSQKLTAERMELRKYFTSLFAVALAEDAGKASGPVESCLRIVDLDEMETDDAANRPFGVEEKNESNMRFAFVRNKDSSLSLQNEVGGFSMTSSTSSLSQMSIGYPLPRSESSPSLNTRLRGTHHSTAMAASSESFLKVPRESQNIEYSSEDMPFTALTDTLKSWTQSSTAQQNKSLNLVPPSSPLSPRTGLNPTLPDIISSPASIPSVISTQSQSPAFLVSEQSPRPPDSPSSRSRLASSPVKPMNRRHSTSHSDQKLIPPPRRVTASACTPSPSSPAHDSIKLPIMEISSHTDGNNTPPPSRWLKGARRSPQTSTLSLEFSMSDSEEDVTGENICQVPSEEDSSDEELRCINDLEVKRNTACPAVTANSLFALRRRENTEAGLLTESSQALRSIAQRRDVQPQRDQGLEGFFTSGLKTGDVLRPTSSQTPRERPSSTKCSLVQDFWRPSSSLRHNAEEGLVNVPVNSRPIRSPVHPVTANHGASQRHQDISSRSSSRVQSASSRRPSSSVRPLSRAAQEILDVQTVEKPEVQNSDEEEEDCLALACLEEEFRNMSCTPCDRNKYNNPNDFD